MYSKPFPIRRPKEGSVMGRPKPKKLSVASKEIACAVCKVPTTINGAIKKAHDDGSDIENSG